MRKFIWLLHMGFPLLLPLETLSCLGLAGPSEEDKQLRRCEERWMRWITFPRSQLFKWGWFQHNRASTNKLLPNTCRAELTLSIWTGKLLMGLIKTQNRVWSGYLSVYCKDTSSATMGTKNTRYWCLVHCRKTKTSIVLYKLKNGAVQYFCNVSTPTYKNSTTMKSWGEGQHMFRHKTITAALWLCLLFHEGSRPTAQIQVTSLDLSSAVSSVCWGTC